MEYGGNSLGRNRVYEKEGKKMAKKYLVKHAKSSAALVSLGIHAVLILVAISFVAVTVITKEDQVFEAKPIDIID